MSDLESTRLQMLRRGRGNGARESLRAGSGAIENVISCVLDDPRWDRQIAPKASGKHTTSVPKTLGSRGVSL